jgi:hypothetical protein
MIYRGFPQGYEEKFVQMLDGQCAQVGTGRAAMPERERAEVMGIAALLEAKPACRIDPPALRLNRKAEPE